MVAAATPRVRPAAPTPLPIPAAGAVVRKTRRSAGAWAFILVPLALGVAFAWQIGSNLVHTEVAAHEAVAVGRVSLESDPAGSRIDVVLVDRVGQETTVNGTVNVKLREPDGALWKVSRSVSPGDFHQLPDGGLLAGRSGYSVVVPASDWMHAPRRGGTATVTITVQPAGDAPAFSTVAEERFP